MESQGLAFVWGAVDVGDGAVVATIDSLSLIAYTGMFIQACLEVQNET